MLVSTTRKGWWRTACALAAAFAVSAGGSVASANNPEPSDPNVDIEKLTNGLSADGANDPDVPRIAPGDPVTWTYIVTNTGGVPFVEADVQVYDNVEGFVPMIVDDGDGDGVLSPGETWIYEATGVAENLADVVHETWVVDGCHPDSAPTYENYGKVLVPGAKAQDWSQYCNPTVPTAALGDFVWLDEDRDGVQDPGEPGVPGVAVELQDCVGNLVTSTTTDADGGYLFDGLEPGGYVVVFTAPDGTVFTVQNAGGDDTVDADADADADADGVTGCVDLAAGETNRTVDAGLIVPTAASGVVAVRSIRRD